ncbi:MAG: V-type ATP synthase subunit D [Treponemataceae bacterium]
MEQVSPTRTELLARKAQIRLAQTGAKLLKGKREALVREFILEIRKLGADREGMMRNLGEALQSLLLSLSIDGPQAIRSVALASRKGVDIELTEHNIWGLEVVDVQSGYHAPQSDEPSYSPFASSARIDETTARFERTVESVVSVAPRLHKLGRLAEEIRSTSRRVNALEQRLLPSLSAQVSYIRSILDQREREDVFRLKRIKRKLSGGS